MFTRRCINYGLHIGSLTFLSAFSMLVLGTPDDLAALRTAASAAFVLGSVEPPASEGVRPIGRRLDRETYIGQQS